MSMSPRLSSQWHPRCRWAAVHIAAKVADAGVAERVDDGTNVDSGGVVDNDAFELREGLIEHALERTSQVRVSVVDRDDDADLGHTRPRLTCPAVSSQDPPPAALLR